MAHEIHEHIEHAGHSGGKLPQVIGITVALLGVLMALCSAQVGAARTDLLSTKQEENKASGRAVAVANKYRTLSAQLQQLHAAMPNPDLIAKKNGELKTLMAEVKNPDTMQGIKATELHTDKVLNTVIPTEEDVNRFLDLTDRIRKESKAAKAWADSYQDAVEVHSNTAEHFEIAMLAAEIGIVIASVGLLLSKKERFARGLWMIAVVLGLISLGVAGWTKMHNSRALVAAEAKIKASEENYEHMNRDEKDEKDDEEMEKAVREDIKRLASGT